MASEIADFCILLVKGAEDKSLTFFVLTFFGARYNLAIFFTFYRFY